jgi:hypothetical protein
MHNNTNLAHPKCVNYVPGSNCKLSAELYNGISVLACMCTILCVYNWYVSGIEAEIQKTSFDAKALGESFRYRLRMGKMGLWGYASLVLGWIAGIALFFGIIVFVLGMWEIIGAVERDRIGTSDKDKVLNSVVVPVDSSRVGNIHDPDSVKPTQ